jgi:putative flavoprotein involved in K+ transport
VLRTRVAVIGAGQAGLAVSHLLTAANVEHVVLERKRVAERWLSQRWDSMRLLTPNWMTRLPGFAYDGADPDGFMRAGEVAAYLGRYAAVSKAPVVTGADLRALDRHRDGYRIATTAGAWIADAAVIATGFADRPAVPHSARNLDPRITQITPDIYRNPGDVPSGAVLVVGASATGVQLADELARSGRDVVLAVGRHTRMPRRYLDRDIMWWLDSMGVLDQRLVAPPGRRRSDPSLQLIGHPDRRDVDLSALAGRGVRLTGRFLGVSDSRVLLADDLELSAAAAQHKLSRQQRRIDSRATTLGLPVPPGSVALPEFSPRSVVPLTLDLVAAGFRTVVWATGYRRDYRWLHLPVLDETGEIIHNAGLTPAPGLAVIGLRRQTRRNSTFIDGVRHDAALVVHHLLRSTLRENTSRAS